MKLTDEALAAARPGGLNRGIVLCWPDDAKPIGLYDTCRCGSGRPFRECCVAFVTAELGGMDRGIGAYIMFADLWPTDTLIPDGVWQLLGRFDPQHLVQTLSRINLKLQSDYFVSNSHEELEVLRIFLPPVWFHKTARWIRFGKRPKALHRLLFPAILVQALARSGAATSEITPESARDTIGQLGLMFNQIIEDDYQAFCKAAQSRSEEMRVFYASIYRQAFYSHAEDYPGALGRISCLIKHGMPAVIERGYGKKFDFAKEFEQIFHFTVDDMLTYGFAVMAHYSSDNTQLFEDPRNFVINRTSLKTIVPEELRTVSERIFDYLALPWQEHVARARQALDGVSALNMYQLYSLYDHPLVEMPDGAIYALDAQFLQARVTEGAYWALFNALLPDGRHAHLRDLFGHATEWYAATLLRESCNRDGTKDLWLDWDGEISGKTRKPDAVLREGDTLYFIEITTSAVSPTDASSGNPDVLADAITKMWFGKKSGDSGKLKQLAQAMKGFRAGTLKLDGIDPTEITRIRPVLVTLRNFPQWPVLMDWYRDLMKAGGMTDQFVDDVLLIDIAELEQLVAQLVAGEHWTTIFAQKRLSNHPDMSVHNFLWITERSKERHPFIVRSIEEAVEAFGGLLRG